MFWTGYRNRLPTDLRYLTGCIFECLDYSKESERKLGCACADGKCRADNNIRIHLNVDDANDSSADARSDALAIDIRVGSLVAYTASMKLVFSELHSLAALLQADDDPWVSGTMRVTLDLYSSELNMWGPYCACGPGHQCG